jgi:hypothetical protein
VERVVRLGFEVRVELTPLSSSPLERSSGETWAQLSRSEAGALELERGGPVWVTVASADPSPTRDPDHWTSAIEDPERPRDLATSVG